jgi:hypothetical protein
VTVSVPVEEIAREAVAFDLRKAASKVALTVVLLLPYLLGWTTRKVVLAVAFVGTAVVIGWREAGSARGGADERP